MVSYASSPAAEVFYSKDKITEPPTVSLSLKGGVFQQVEGVALVKGGKQAGKFCLRRNTGDLALASA